MRLVKGSESYDIADENVIRAFLQAGYTNSPNQVTTDEPKPEKVEARKVTRTRKTNK